MDWLIVKIVFKHLPQIDLHTLINETSLFPILEVSFGIFLLFGNFNKAFCKQTIQNRIRRHKMWRLIRFCTVYTCKKDVRRICLYGITHSGMRLNKVEFTNGSILLQKKEQARLEKIKELDKTDQTAALESFAEYQKKKEENVSQKLESASDNREKRLQAIKEKAKERDRRREEVRKRKQMQKELAQQQGDDQGTSEIIGDASDLMERQETPIVPE